MTKRERLESLIVPLLMCPECGATSLSLSADHILCSGCERRYEVRDDVPLMVSDPSTAVGYDDSVEATRPYSSHWISLVEKAHPGLVLDFGSGNSPNKFDNVVKMDIFAFENHSDDRP